MFSPSDKLLTTISYLVFVLCECYNSHVIGINPAYINGTNPTYINGSDPAYIDEINPAYINEPSPTYVNGSDPTHTNETHPTYISETNPAYINGTNQQWDVVLLAQHWLPTNCMMEKYRDSSIACKMPINTDSWTIHGVWASNFEHSSPVPYECIRDWQLKLEEIASIQRELDDVWPDILRKPTSFWEHEWSKHGTCFVELPAWDSPVKYFTSAIHLRNTCDVATVLKKANILPSLEKTYKVNDFFKAIQNGLGKKPWLKCFVQNDKQYISEIHVCFTKTLDMLDCKRPAKYSTVLEKYEKPLDDGVKHVPCDTSMDVLYRTYNSFIYGL